MLFVKLKFAPPAKANTLVPLFPEISSAGSVALPDRRELREPDTPPVGVNVAAPKLVAPVPPCACETGNALGIRASFPAANVPAVVPASGGGAFELLKGMTPP